MQMQAILVGVWLALAGVFPTLATAQDAPLRATLDTKEPGSMQGMQDWVKAFRARALAKGVTAETFDTEMQGRTYLPEIVVKDRKQDEFTKTIWDYLDKAVSDDRIAAGKAALAEHAALFDQLEARYSVDRAVIAAIWGLESAYGKVRGDIPTLDALTTLAYDARRADFFEGQLVEALLILQSGDITADRMLGSWAGAMGHTQFMPSSYRSLAVDFDGDGKRQIWGDDPTDALASTAAYLAKSNWVKGQPWGVEVTLPQGFDYTLAGPRTQAPLSTWKARGLLPMGGQEWAKSGWASLSLPAGARGPAFLVFDNFTAIETYNVADAYVIAVGHLADRIMGAAPIQANWPRDLRALTLEERIEMQHLLGQNGFDPFGVDGKVGPNTIAAVRKFQASAGVVPDGYASLDLLERLRATPVQAKAAVNSP